MLMVNHMLPGGDGRRGINRIKPPIFFNVLKF